MFLIPNRYRNTPKLATSTLSNHLMSAHDIIKTTKETSAPTKSVTNFFEVSPRSGSTGSNAKSLLARRIGLHLCSRSLLPFSIASNDGFIDFLLAYNIVKRPEEMPSSRTVSRSVTSIYKEVESGLTKFISFCKPQSVAAAYDMWTDKHGRNNYINISVQFVDKDWNLRNINLGTDPLSRPHTAVRIEAHIDSVFTKHNLQDLLLVSVKDNGANVKACAKSMAARMGFKDGNADDFECFAHNLHLLIMKDVLKDPLHEDLRLAIAKVKKTHRSLAFKSNELKQMSLEDQSLQLQNYLIQLDGDIGMHNILNSFHIYSLYNSQLQIPFLKSKLAMAMMRLPRCQQLDHPFPSKTPTRLAGIRLACFWKHED